MKHFRSLSKYKSESNELVFVVTIGNPNKALLNKDHPAKGEHIVIDSIGYAVKKIECKVVMCAKPYVDSEVHLYVRSLDKYSGGCNEDSGNCSGSCGSGCG